MERLSSKFRLQLAAARCNPDLRALGQLIASKREQERCRALLCLAEVLNEQGASTKQVRKIFKLSRRCAADNYWLLRRIRSLELVLHPVFASK